MISEKRQRRRIRRDRRRERRKVHANPYIHRFLRFVIRHVLNAVFHMEVIDRDLVTRDSGPFILLGNHSAVIDPFLIGVFVNKPVHYVVSDSQFRSRLLSWVLGLAGSIPKTKVMSDLDTVKKIVAVKNAGGVIGIFPEGQSSWDGNNLPIVRATDKLIKSLKIPVYVARIEGAYLSWPRWARRPRRGRVRITYRQLFSGADLRALPVSAVGERIEAGLAVDAFEFQHRVGYTYRGARLAEYLERVLFVCPNCRGISTIRSHRRRVNCTSCGYSVVFNNRGFFEARRGPLVFETVRDWNNWQRDVFSDYLEEMYKANTTTDANTPLLTEPVVIVREGFKTQPLQTLGRATMALFPDRLTMTLDGGALIDLTLDSIEGINVQNNEHLEFYSAMTLYRISTADPRGNTFKWDYAVRYLQQKDRVHNVASVSDAVSDA